MREPFRTRAIIHYTLESVDSSKIAQSSPLTQGFGASYEERTAEMQADPEGSALNSEDETREEVRSRHSFTSIRSFNH